MLRQDFQLRLDAVNAWMSSPAYPDVQKALEVELAGINDSILNTSPNDAEAVAMLNMWHGTRVSVLKQLSYFEDLRNALKTRIDQMVEDGTIVAETEEITQTNEH